MLSTLYILSIGIASGVVVLTGWLSGKTIYDNTRGNTNVRMLNFMMNKVDFEYKEFPKEYYGYEKNIYLNDWMCDYSDSFLIQCIVKIIDANDANFMNNECDGLEYIYDMSNTINKKIE